MKTESKPDLFWSLITYCVNNHVKNVFLHNNICRDAGDDICSEFKVLNKIFIKITLFFEYLLTANVFLPKMFIYEYQNVSLLPVSEWIYGVLASNHLVILRLNTTFPNWGPVTP